MTDTNMTWKPMICEIITSRILPPDHNAIQNKWQMIQKHNSPGNSNEQQTLSTQGYLIQLQEIYEAKTRQNEQMVIWTSTEQIKNNKRQPQQRTNQKDVRGNTTKTPTKNNNPQENKQ